MRYKLLDVSVVITHKKEGYTMAIRKKTVKAGQKPTEEQRKRIREAMKRPIVYDDDAPKLTEEQYKAFARAAKEQRSLSRKG